MRRDNACNFDNAAQTTRHFGNLLVTQMAVLLRPGEKKRIDMAINHFPIIGYARLDDVKNIAKIFRNV